MLYSELLEKEERGTLSKEEKYELDYIRWDNNRPVRLSELSKKEDECKLTKEEQDELDWLEQQAEWEMYEDLKYQW